MLPRSRKSVAFAFSEKSVKVRYFAWVRERVGKPEEEIEPPPGIATVGDLITWLAGRGDEYARAFENPKVIRAAIDRAHVRGVLSERQAARHARGGVDR